MEEAFKKVVHQIFENWTALILAIEHSDVRSKPDEVFGDFVTYMTQYCLYTSNVDQGGIEEALDDIMDQEFDTVCEDNSTKEIATVLYKFLDLLKQNDLTRFEEEFQKLPVNTVCSFTTSKQRNENVNRIGNTSSEAPDDDDDSEEPMEDEDSEWTVVKSKRKH